MPRTAEVIYVGDAASLLRANEAALASTNTAAAGIEKAGAKAGASYSGMSAAGEKAADDLKGSHNSIVSSLAGIGTAGSGAVAGVVALGAAIYGIKKSADTLAEVGKETLTLHNVTGLSIQSASAYSAVAKAQDLNVKQLNQAFGTLSKNTQAVVNAHDGLTKSAKTQENAFRLLGIPLNDIIRAHGNMNVLMPEVIHHFEAMPGGVEKAAVGMALFGRGWQTLVPLMHTGALGMQEQLDVAKKMGATLEGVSVGNLKQFQKAQEESKYATLGLQLAVGQYLAPALTSIITTFAHLVAGIQPAIEWLKKHEEVARALAVVIGSVLGAVVLRFAVTTTAAFVGGIGSMVTSLAGLVTASETSAVAVDGALMSTGIGAAVVALGLAAFELKEHWDEVMKGLEEAAVAAANSVIEDLNAIIKSINEFTNAISLGLIPAIGEIGKVSLEKGGMSNAEANEAEREGGPREIGGSKSNVQGGIMAYFESKGLSRAQAAGIIGNIEQESSSNPNAPGGGLFQGIGSRSGLGHGSVKQQIETAWKELSSNPEYGLAALKKAKSPEEAARIFSEHFEKPGTPMVGNRETYAREALEAHPAKAVEHNTAAVERLTHALGGAPGAGLGYTELSAHAKAHHVKVRGSGEASPGSITRWAEGSIGHFAESTGQNTGPELDKLQAEFHTRAAAWCAEFATTAAMMGGANKAVRTASVATIREWAEQGSHGYKKGVSHTPHVGDMMMFGNSHVGFVQAVHGGQVTTIEGNANDPGGVKRFTHSIGEGDYASPLYPKSRTGSGELKEIGKGFSDAAKQWLKEESAAKKAAMAEAKREAGDEKAGKAELNKLLAAIQSGGVKELTSVVGGIHQTNLLSLQSKLSGDHSAALTKLAKEVADAHRRALEALVAKQTEAFHELIDTLTSKMEDLVSKAGQVWASMETKAMDQRHKDALKDLETGPEGQALKADKEKVENTQRERTEFDNAVALEKAKEKLKEAKWTGDKKKIKEAEVDVKKSEETITLFGLDQDAKRREKAIAAQKESIETGYNAEKEALAERTKNYEAMLGNQLAALVKQLNSAEIDYRSFAVKVNETLEATGISFTPTPAQEAIANANTPPWPKNPAEWPAYEQKYGQNHGAHRAAGGMVYSGIQYNVGEAGPERFTPSTTGVITPASRSSGGAGPQVHVHGDMNVSSGADADRMVSRLAFRLKHG